MKRKGIFTCAFCCLLFLSLNIGAQAAPYFDKVSFYTEHNLTFPNIWSYHFGAFVFDDQYNIASVVAKSVTTNDEYILSDLVTITGEWKWGSVGIDNEPWLDQLEIIATNTNGEISTVLTHVLDKEKLFGLATNITISDLSVTPTFSWDDVADAGSYCVRILDSFGTRIFDSNLEPGTIHDTSYTLPSGVLAPGESYQARIIANNWDYEKGKWELENRSSNYLFFTTAPIHIVAIDIKPGSEPNCFNINGHGVIPVAIFGSDSFDVSQIDINSLLFGGLEVRVRGNKGPLCSIEYSNGDTYQDLVCHFEDESSSWNPGDGQATLTGKLFDDTSFEGTDSICVVP